MKATAANLTNPIANLRHCSENARAPMQTPKMQDRKATVSISNPMAPQGHPAGAEMKYRTSLMRSGTHQGTINLTPKSSRAIRVFGSLQEMNVIRITWQQPVYHGRLEMKKVFSKCRFFLGGFQEFFWVLWWRKQASHPGHHTNKP